MYGHSIFTNQYFGKERGVTNKNFKPSQINFSNVDFLALAPYVVDPNILSKSSKLVALILKSGFFPFSFSIVDNQPPSWSLKILFNLLLELPSWVINNYFFGGLSPYYR